MTEDVGTLEPREIEWLRAEAARLREEVEELQASRERLVRCADAERSGIERELHDGLQQQLVALAVTLQHARRLIVTDQVAAQALLDELAQDIRVAVDDARALALRVFPPLLDTGGLRLALRTAATSAGSPAEIEAPDVDRWPREIAAAIYFYCIAVLEQLGSSVHSVVAVREAAGAATFEITVLDSSVVLEAADLAPQQERVEALRGRAVVSRGGGRGALVRGSLPLPSGQSLSAR